MRMELTLEQLAAGLEPGKDLVFPRCPDDPQMRESCSIWLFEQSGAFAFPRIGIEAEASSWDMRRVQGNFAVAGGRILNGAGLGAAHSPFGPDGRPTVLGAGPLAMRCIEPFRRWHANWEGTVVDGTVEQQIAGTLDPARRSALGFDVELEMATPAWVQDISPAVVARMSAADAIEAANMGIGWRFEQLFRAAGVFRLDGRSREFTGTGLRIKRQSVRPLGGFRGHCWQSALFPDGRAFGYIAYPPREDGTAWNEGYVYRDGRMYAARAPRAVAAPHRRRGRRRVARARIGAGNHPHRRRDRAVDVPRRQPRHRRPEPAAGRRVLPLGRAECLGHDRALRAREPDHGGLIVCAICRVRCAICRDSRRSM